MYPAPASYDVLCPEHILEEPVMVGDGFEFTVNVFDAEPVQPLLLVTVTIYVPAVETEIACVVAPVDQA